jgi:dynein heavy chain 1
MLRILITEMYGGKIDDESDFRTLSSIVEDCMTPAAFEDNFKIVKDTEHSQGLELPSTTGWKDFMSWARAADVSGLAGKCGEVVACGSGEGDGG